MFSRKLCSVSHRCVPLLCTQFKDLQKAYDILSDPEKRNLYDRFGEDAAEKGHGHSHGGGIFEQMFGTALRTVVDRFALCSHLYSNCLGGGGGGQPRGKRKGEDSVFSLAVELSHLYLGSARKLSVTRPVVCGACSG